MEPFATIMDVTYQAGPKKRWRTVCQNERAPKQRHNQTSLSAWIRPPSWTKAPLDLSEDVASLIVEALMREGVGNVQEIRAFALVNRTCASATAATLLSVCVQLRTLSSRVAQEEKRGRAHARRHSIAGASDNNSDSDSSDDCSIESCDKVDDDDDDQHVARLESRRAEFVAHMALVGIPLIRRLQLAKLPGRVWFQNNRSLLGHLMDGCELCGSSLHIQYPVYGGPVALFACTRCRQKDCTRLSLEFTRSSKSSTHLLVARVLLWETEANNYARALFSKREAHRKRMHSHRTSTLGKTNLAKSVHEVTFTNELLLCYAKSKWKMSRAPWQIELWHRLPAGVPQRMTFGEVMGVRDSDLVRDEARREAKRRGEVRSRATRRSHALSRILVKYRTTREHMWRVVSKGHMCGWVQAIEICSSARAFDTRWMFYADVTQHMMMSTDLRRLTYKLLEIHDDVLEAATRRISSVARVVYLTKNDISRQTVLRLVRNFPLSLLEGPIDCVHEVVQMIYGATVELRIVRESTSIQQLEVCYHSGEAFPEGPLYLQCTLSKYTSERIAKMVGMNFGGGLFTNDMLRYMEGLANGPNLSKGKDEALAAIFSLPTPSWPLSGFATYCNRV